MAADEANNTTIAQLRNRLIELDRERASVLDAIEQLQSCDVAEVRPTPSSHDIRHPAKTKALSNADKIALFSLALRGRDDVFPIRWQHLKAGKSGYAPACHNERVRGICLPAR